MTLIGLGMVLVDLVLFYFYVFFLEKNLPLVAATKSPKNDKQKSQRTHNMMNT